MHYIIILINIAVLCCLWWTISDYLRVNFKEFISCLVWSWTWQLGAWNILDGQEVQPFLEINLVLMKGRLFLHQVSCNLSGLFGKDVDPICYRTVSRSFPTVKKNIPSTNCFALLKNALKDLLSQQLKYWEFFLKGDGSQNGNSSHSYCWLRQLSNAFPKWGPSLVMSWCKFSIHKNGCVIFWNMELLIQCGIDGGL